MNELLRTLFGENALQFAQPWLLLGLLPAVAVLLWRRPGGGAEFGAYSIARAVLRVSRGPWLWRVLMGVGCIALTLSLARPQFGSTIVERTQSGRDFMLVIDFSASMRVDDMFDADGERVDRMATVISAAKRFIERRPHDRIGLTYFAGQAFVSYPLTFEHQALIDNLDEVEAEQRRLWDANRGLYGEGTNIGLGLAKATEYLEESETDRDAAEGKAVILITDGADSRELPNWVDPLEAARIAESFAIPCYTIGVGDPQGMMSNTRFGRRQLIPVRGVYLPDMGRLRQISELSKGSSMLATKREELDATFAKLDTLEPSEFTSTTRQAYRDVFFPSLLLGLCCCGLAIVAEPRLRGLG